jgi:hypothetical protein
MNKGPLSRLSSSLHNPPQRSTDWPKISCPFLGVRSTPLRDLRIGQKYLAHFWGSDLPPSEIYGLARNILPIFGGQIYPPQRSTDWPEISCPFLGVRSTPLRDLRIGQKYLALFWEVPLVDLLELLSHNNSRRTIH